MPMPNTTHQERQYVLRPFVAPIAEGWSVPEGIEDGGDSDVVVIDD